MLGCVDWMVIAKNYTNGFRYCKLVKIIGVRNFFGL